MANADGSVTTSDTTELQDSDPNDSKLNKLNTILAAVGLGIGVVVISGIWGSLFAGSYYVGTGDLPIRVEAIINGIGLGLGTATTLWIYFKYSDKGLSYIDIEKPTLKQIGIAIAGVVALLVLAFAVDTLLRLIGVSRTDHHVYESITGGGSVDVVAVILFMIVSVLVIGPAEEIVFRGIIQKSLYSVYPTVKAIFVTSIIFSIVHIPAYFTTGGMEIVGTLTIIFVLSIILGAIYEYTENITIPAVVHGVYNAILFGMIYVEEIVAI